MAAHDNTPSDLTLAAVLEASRWYYSRLGVVPPAAEMARLLGFDPSYIHQALRELVARGLMLRPIQRGGYVPADCAPEGAASFSDRLTPE